jgi:hypothetical protein
MRAGPRLSRRTPLLILGSSLLKLARVENFLDTISHTPMLGLKDQLGCVELDKTGKRPLEE